jgi:hypothetical protein
MSATTNAPQSPVWLAFVGMCKAQGLDSADNHIWQAYQSGRAACEGAGSIPSEAEVDEYVEEYACEFDVGPYSPTSRERFIIKDAIMGMLANLDESRRAALAVPSEGIRHSTNEFGDCPHWCKACEKEASSRAALAGGIASVAASEPTEQELASVIRSQGLVGWDIAGQIASYIAKWRIEVLRAALRAAQPPSEAETLLPHGYLFAKCAMVVPLLQEARDALTALSEAQRIAYGISKTLADRMDVAGTFSTDDWRAGGGQ